MFNFDGITGKRVLDEVYVTDAALNPVSSTKGETCAGTKDADTIKVASNFSLSGTLVFSRPDISTEAAPDPFSYGDPNAIPVAGLPFAGYHIAMCTEIKENRGHIAKIGPDLGDLRVRSAGATPRENSVVNALPLKLNSFAEWTGTGGPSGWPVQGTGFSQDTFAARFGLQFQLSLGSLGALSSVAESLEVELIIGWKPGDTQADDDTVWLLMVPPKTMQGREGFGIEGVLAATFAPVELASVFWPTDQTEKIEYAIYLKNFGIELLSHNLIPPNLADFTLFTKPGGGGNKSNLGWLGTLRIPKPG